jgi:hypothetical protein
MSNSLKRFKKIPSKDNVTKQLQNNVEEAINPIINSQIVDGVLVRDVCLLALKPNLVTHKLGREPLGYVIVRKRADSRIWDVQDDNINKTTTLAITCSHDVQVDLWVF